MTLVLVLQQLESAAIPTKSMVLHATTAVCAVRQILAKVEFVPELTLYNAHRWINVTSLEHVMQLLDAATPPRLMVLLALTAMPALKPTLAKVEAALETVQ